MTTIRDALEQGTAALTLVGQTPKPRLDAQVLLSHVLDVERSTLYTYPERLLTAQQEQQFSQLIERRKLGEPIAYLTGHKEFFGLDFLVDRRVLIPRPETELLVEAALSIIHERLAGARVPVVADIGTGSGIIPITLAVQEPRLPYLYASDISSDALAVADLLTANLPYVGTDEMEELTPEVHAYEPHLALFSGHQGLDAMRRFFTEAQQPGKLKPGAILLLEIGYQQRELLSDLLPELWPHATITFIKDYAGWDRLLQVSL